MPLDILLFRAGSGGNPDIIKESQRRRFKPVESVDEIIEEDEKWRKISFVIDNLKKERNTVQKQVAEFKKAKQECDELVGKIKTIGEEIAIKEKEQEELKVKVDKLVSKIGNLVADDVPVGIDEDTVNRVERKWGTPRDPTGLLNHHDLLWRIGGYEPERGSAVAGHRGYFLKDVGVLLNQAFINYGIAFLRARGYCPLQPPYFMNKEIMAGVAQLEEFDEALYHVAGGEAGDKYLIATSEQPICGYHMGEWMEEKLLPIKYAGISTCFRKEAGSHGKDTWGIFRVHQFEKVEQFVICEGDIEVSKKMQDEMIACAEEFYQSLGFPYHVINIASGALNNAAIKKLDLECWFPGYNAYRELVSCSNCTDYQSRAMEIRCGIKKLGDREKKYVHMLNATLCATGRAICCLLENYQEKDGVRIPEVLVPFMGGMTFLPFVRDSKLAPKVDAPPPAPKEKSDSSSSKANAQTGVGASDLEAEILRVGDEVRDLKLNKADKDIIKLKVDELLMLKQKLGGDSKAPAASVKSDTPVKSKSTPPPVPAPKKEDVNAFIEGRFPKYTTPKPQLLTGGIALTTNLKSIPSDDEIFIDDSSLNLDAMDAKLAYYPFLMGFKPSNVDVKALNILYNSNTPSTSGHNNINRWFKHCNSYSFEEKQKW